MSATTPERIGAARDHETAARARARTRSLIRGRTADPAWVRPALLSLLAATALLYLVDLAASGWANGFYSAAVQAGTKSWKAFFFGSFDSSNFITVDKSPAALWADGDLGAHLRRQLVEHPRSAGARGRRVGRAALPRPCGVASRPRPGCSPARCSRSRRSRR